MKPRTLQLFQSASRNARRSPAPDLATPKWLRIENKGDEATINIYGIIDPFSWWDDSAVSAKDILNQLEDIKAKTIHVRIKSEGGSVFDGVAIYNLLREHDARIIVHIDSLAASIASVIAMAGDEIIVSEAASVMIHKPSTVIWGSAAELRHEADILDTIEEQITAVYVRRTGQEASTLEGWLKDERWMSGKQAVEDGFADRLAEDAPAPTPQEKTNLAQAPQKSSTPKGDAKSVPLAVRKRQLAVLQLTNQN